MFEYKGQANFDKKAFVFAAATFTLACISVSILTTLLITLIWWIGARLGFSFQQVFCADVTFLTAFLIFCIPLSNYVSRIAWGPIAETLERVRSLSIDAGHELATPVSVISARMQLLERSGSLDKCEPSTVEAVKTALRDLTTLVEDLRILAQSESAKRKANLAFVGLNDLVSESIIELESEAALRKIAFVLKAPTRLSVVGDSSGLKRVVSNLLTNAIKYGDRSSEVSITLLDDGKNVVIEIANLGAGIPLADLPHLFDRYYRAVDRETSNLKGSGLGLAIVKSIMDAHGGTVKVVNLLDKGSQFTVVLPKHPPVHPALALLE